MTQASSLDGRSFHFDDPDGTPFVPGSFVVFAEPDRGLHLGQVDSIEVMPDGGHAGAGRLLGRLSADGAMSSRVGAPFHAAEVTEAGDDAIDRLFADAGATLPIGRLNESPGVAARLIPGRFNRHTFWCGQSGSGKTYALGVVLEQLLVATRLPMVVFDPNADFVRLRELRESAEAAPEQDALASRRIRVLRPEHAGGDPLRVRFTDLSMRSRAAVLGIDPLVDRGEYNALLHLESQYGIEDQDQIVPRLRATGDPADLALALRIENLRLLDWELWSGATEAVTDALEERPDATVLDIGGFTFPDEHLVVALSVLDDLWAKREQRRPILIVIDEAHNLCAPDQDTPLGRAVRDRIVQIAAEGRKFGLWLLLSTQRPSKVHPSILSQCDNLALMKMSSPVDLAELATVFGFAPAALLERSPAFRQGEALFAGGFVPAPTVARMRTRLTEEGGVDVRVPLR
ncbi:ATP-binding protein [Herbiconiux sp. UC225_62]|uniref:ATP-binding protein n=1 Tax=Herbiconiux sp. UC225_62 TaxID=3350168 RepID=UPI0036D3F86E